MKDKLNFTLAEISSSQTFLVEISISKTYWCSFQIGLQMYARKNGNTLFSVSATSHLKACNEDLEAPEPCPSLAGPLFSFITTTLTMLMRKNKLRTMVAATGIWCMISNLESLIQHLK